MQIHWKNNKNPSLLLRNFVPRPVRNKNLACSENLVSRCARNNKKGSLAIELLLVIAIINIALVSLLGLASFSLRSSSLLKESSRADSLAQEALEAVRNFRDGTTWTTNGIGNLTLFTLDTAYHPEKTIDTPPKWNLVTGEETINGFSRKIVIKKVFRDVNGNIAGSGTEDPDARKIIATVTWKDKKVEIVNYLTNWRQ
ncbi:MAG: hypothetical protein COX90_02535 [Candidatus Nealsonbacteria bacterium CG_4_10_14_0_2_um_filter_38_17]|uniref:Type 4 fimbrial biogenesis protein PilX N-terminal domain-containing protein n=1 Tax=Candidatus Nealsonbacteria bacterium CG_4_10_14_0_2_um_filter_38_17 TaxID=1974680 RepID=A0A2M7UXV6_9BACT|nr:MAG: hypothetical protein COX90_02535 [Candidatus Nealsonbacteria bacterium CG_4_10_14_0_2_um_filter_38_17]